MQNRKVLQQYHYSILSAFCHIILLFNLRKLLKGVKNFIKNSKKVLTHEKRYDNIYKSTRYGNKRVPRSLDHEP